MKGSEKTLCTDARYYKVNWKADKYYTFLHYP